VKTNFTVIDIMEIIPHRHPFLLVDRITYISDDFKEVTGIKSVSYNEPFFQGHFPGKPVMPGVLQIEAIAQTVAFMVLKFDEMAKSYRGLALTGLKNVKYRRPVVPGDKLVLNAKVLKNRGPHYTFYGTSSVDDEITCEGNFQAVFLDPVDGKSSSEFSDGSAL